MYRSVGICMFQHNITPLEWCRQTDYRDEIFGSYSLF